MAWFNHIHSDKSRVPISKYANQAQLADRSSVPVNLFKSYTNVSITFAFDGNIELKKISKIMIFVYSRIYFQFIPKIFVDYIEVSIVKSTE